MHAALTTQPPPHLNSLRTCSNTACARVLKYDGRDDSLLVLNGDYAVSQVLLDSFEIALYVNGATFTSFASTQQFAYENLYTPEHFLEHPRFNFTRARLGLFIVQYRRLIDWAAVDPNMICPCCGAHPKTLVFDGTAEGFPSRLLHKMNNDPRPIVQGVEVEGCARNELMFLPTSALNTSNYKLLVRFVRAPPASSCAFGSAKPTNSVDEPALSKAECETLLSAFAAADAHPRARALLPVLQYAVDNNNTGLLGDGNFACDPALAHFLYPLLTNSTAFAAYRPAEHAALARDLLASTSLLVDKGLLARVRELTPWIANFFRDMAVDVVPPYARASLAALETFAQQLSAFEQKYVVTTLPVKDQSPKTLAQLKASLVVDETVAAAAIEDALQYEDRAVEADLDQGMWFGPGLRTCRRGLFNYVKKHANEDQYRNCNKYAPTSRAHTPGIFSALCPHGYVVAIIFMRSGESPAHVFDIVLNRFPEGKRPTRIIYDNACSLSRYSLAREPVAFAGCRFLVDRLHWKNHTRCSTAFRMWEFSEYDPVVAAIDSQRAEQ